MGAEVVVLGDVVGDFLVAADQGGAGAGADEVVPAHRFGATSSASVRPPCSSRLRKRPPLLGNPPDHRQPSLRAEGGISVQLHPVSSLLLGGSAPPAFKEARMNNVVRNYT